MKTYRLILIVISILFLPIWHAAFAQEQEKILYYQMEPLDDSLFIKIQKEVFIDPPDPKAEIIVDLRDANNQTVSIKGTLYPFLAFTPETRAKIETYPFKLNLGETINFGSVFTKVLSKIRFGKVVQPPTAYQISPSLSYINPFLQLFGGERFGVPFKDDIGLSFGVGTPYSGVLETNAVEGDFHILGFTAGVIGPVDALTEIRTDNNHNNLYFGFAYQLGYVIPFGNFFEISFTDVIQKPSESNRMRYLKNDVLNPDSSIRYSVKVVDKSYFNWELRYPFSLMGSTRGKFYVAEYLNEWHVGYTGRELSLAGSTFDLRLDAMVKSDIRQPQYVCEVLVQKVAASWAFSAFAIGPAITLSTLKNGSFGIIGIFADLRLKVGTSF